MRYYITIYEHFNFDAIILLSIISWNLIIYLRIKVSDDDEFYLIFICNALLQKIMGFMQILILFFLWWQHRVVVPHYLTDGSFIFSSLAPISLLVSIYYGIIREKSLWEFCVRLSSDLCFHLKWISCKNNY